MPEFKEKYGSHAKVFNGTAEMTAGRLKKGDLMKNKHGRIVSKKKHAQGKKSIKFLRRAGYRTKKGQFGAIKTTTRKSR
tara:strand:+ start:1221 stop:1457 length:237 start_codon:yes stop_codon:yes gene_type:complete